MRDLSCFSLGNTIRHLSSINVSINFEHQAPFPKPRARLLSYYTYHRRPVKISDKGYYNRARLISSLIDFSFVRSLVASSYSSEGGPAYDPVSLFLLDLFRFLDGFKSMKSFCNQLHHKYNGHAYRIYAGVSDERIPCEADFSNLRVRIGEEQYKAIFHLLVDIVSRLGLVSGRIVSTDGTLVHTFARYRGCNYACKDCANIRVGGDFIKKTRNKILKLLENPSSINPEKERRAYAKCPRKDELPKDVNPPSIQVVAYKIVPFNPELIKENDWTEKILGLQEELRRHNLMILPLRSNISHVDSIHWGTPIYVRCPRMPADLQAKIGYRRSKYNPDKKEKVFGYQLTITTSIDPELGIELPLACITGPGSSHDGNHFIPLREEIKKYHPLMKTRIDIGDAGFDDTPNYNYSRESGSLPIFDYNPRNEDLSWEALLRRGYNQKGYPFAPCHGVTRPNGYEEKNRRVSFVCAKQCLSSPQSVPHPIPSCRHLEDSLGFATHMPMSKNPRLITEIPRGSLRWKKIRNMRVSSERTNSTAKSDLDILNRPRVMGLNRTSILAQVAVMVILLVRVLRFITRITLSLRRFINSSDKKYWKEFQLHKIPPWLNHIIQRE